MTSDVKAFSQKPYFDDFDEQNNFNRILFRPGIPVQTRELNQLQTILQDQIAKGATFSFRNGTRIRGGETQLIKKLAFVKLQNLLQVDGRRYIGANIARIVGGEKVIEAEVVSVIRKTETDPDTFYIRYLSSNTEDNSTTFKNNQQLTVELVDGTIELVQTTTTSSVGNALAFQVNEGVFFFNGHFVFVPRQFTVVNKYSTAVSEIEQSVGFVIFESVITPEEDPSLFDNSFGTPNESAPGAHRYKIEAFLVTKGVNDVIESSENVLSGDSEAIPEEAINISNYYEIAKIRFGEVQPKPRQDNDFSILEQTFARRTFDESGDYIVDDFVLSLREHLNTGITRAATYSQTLRTITVSLPSHNLQVGEQVTLKINSGSSLSGTYIVSELPVANPINTFNVISRESRTSSGDVSVTAKSNRGLYSAENGGTEEKVGVVLDKGIAYVRGFEVRTEGNTFLETDKSRSTITEDSVVTQLQYANSVFVYSTTFMTNPELYSRVSIRDAGNVVRGTAFVRGWKFEKDVIIGGTPRKAYRLDLLNVQFNTGYSFQNVTNFFIAGSPAFNALIVPQTVIPFDIDSAEGQLVFEVPYGFTKVVTPILFTRYYEISGSTESASGQPTLITIGAPTSEQFDDETTSFSVYINHGGGHSGTPQSVVLTNAGQTATLDVTNLVGNNVNGAAYTIVAKTFNRAPNIRTKTLTARTQTLAAASTINLDRTDIYRVVAIYSGTTNLTNDFILDNGQRNTHYDFGSLKLRSGRTLPTGNLVITYSYFEHGPGDFFTVDSYNAISYDVIPSFTNAKKQTFFLGNCVDFRQRMLTSTTLEEAGAHSFIHDEQLFADLEFYVARKDSIVLSKNGEFSVVQGTPSTDPSLPQPPVDSITLYNMYLPPYTLNLSDITVVKVEQRRYTMSDIGKIVTRLENVENVASLSLLETQINSKQEFNKFRNGFFVDNFQSQLPSDIDDPSHMISYDFSKSELRPMSIISNIDLDITTQSNVRVHDDGIVTLQYTEVPFVRNDLASRTVRLQPYAFYDFVGQIKLNPPTDIWTDTREAEVFLSDTQITRRYTFDKGTGINRINGLKYRATWDFVNGIWRSVDTGKLATASQAASLNAAIKRFPQTNVQTVSSTTTTTLQNSVNTTTAITYIRSRVVSFSAIDLKPLSRVYLKFDGVDISAFAGMTEATIGQPLMTSGGGSIEGVFVIPGDSKNIIGLGAHANAPQNTGLRFQTGRRKVVLSDLPGNTENHDTLVASTFYTAAGTLITTTNTFLTTRTALTSGRVYDPVAQSFFVKDDAFKEGVFISSIDVYFGPGISPTTNKDSVRLELRNMVNGYPGPEIPHNGAVTVPASGIFGSADASRATRFTFPSPVYLEDDLEYCFVLVSNSTTINVWTSKLGDRAVVPGERTPNSGQVISKQPFLGSFFLSQNDTTWTADQLSDMKFVINRANFTTSGEVSFGNKVPTTETNTIFDEHISILETNPFKFVSGSNVVKIYDFGHGFSVGDRVILRNSQITDSNIGQISFNGIPASQLFTTATLNSTGLLITNVETAGGPDFGTYEVTVITNANATGSEGGDDNFASRFIDYSSLFLINDAPAINGTSVSYSFRGRRESNSTLQSFQNIIPGNEITLPFEYTVKASNDGSMTIRSLLRTTKNTISPVLDKDRISAVVQKNIINNTADILDNNSDGAVARYIQKPLSVITPSNMIDVFIDCNIPSGSNVKVYFKTGNTEIEGNWTEMPIAPQYNIITTEDPEVFQETKWSTENLGLLPEFFISQVKIVLTSSNKAKVPRLKNYRSIVVNKI